MIETCWTILIYVVLAALGFGGYALAFLYWKFYLDERKKVAEALDRWAEALDRIHERFKEPD